MSLATQPLTVIGRRRELEQAVSKEINSRLERGPIGEMQCSNCEVKEWVGGMFKCFFCLAWFCQGCAEKHFGKTREEYWKEKNKTTP